MDGSIARAHALAARRRPRLRLRLLLPAAAWVSLLSGGAACMAPPWSMGAPLNGRPSIPDTTAAPSIRWWRALASTERFTGRTVLELRALRALARAERLTPEEQERLVALLEPHAAELLAMRRSVPACDDLREIDRLAPARGAALRAMRAAAERDAGDAWLAVGDVARARAAYQAAQAAGADAAVLDFRLAALAGGEPPPGTALPALEKAIAELPLRAVPPFAQAYVRRGGSDPQLLDRALRAARQEKKTALGARIQDAIAAAAAPTESPPQPDPAELPSAPIAAEPPPDVDTWVLGGAALSFRLLPLLQRFPTLLAPGPRPREWANLLLEEDPTSPDVLEAAALIDGLAGRTGGAERNLTDLIYFTPDRYEGMLRAAAIWERVGQGRSSCALWVRAARWRDEPDDPAWRSAIACTRRDPGAGDWRSIRQYVLDRTPVERREAAAATLDRP